MITPAVMEKDLEVAPVEEVEKSRLWPRLKKALIWTGASILGLYLLVLLVLGSAQTSLLYQPTKETLPLPSEKGYGWTVERTGDDPVSFEQSHWERVEIKTEDGETLVCYWLNFYGFKKLPNEKPFTMIHFHGNAGHIGHRLSQHMHLMSYMHYRVLLVGYRGYGESTGVPSEKGFQLDAQAALDWTLDRLSEQEREKLVVYGQSMGGAVAINLAAKNPDKLKHLVVENTFLSIAKLIPDVSPLLGPVVPLLHQIWNSEEAIKSVKQHVIFLSAEDDALIPPAHMKKLHQLATNAASATLISVPESGHNDAFLSDTYCFGMRNQLRENFKSDSHEQ